MAYSKVSLCNDALVHLGQPRLVIDADADHQEHSHAETVVSNYDVALSVVLEDHPWTFAKRRSFVEAAGTPPAFGWTYAYPLPTLPDTGPCVRVWKVAPDSKGKTSDFEVEGGQILTNEPGPLPVEWVALVTDPSKFSGNFALALSLRIASLSCMKVLNSSDDVERLDKTYERTKSSGQSVSSQQKPQQQGYETSWLDGRGVS